MFSHQPRSPKMSPRAAVQTKQSHATVPHPSQAAAILQLQKQYGNQAVQHLLAAQLQKTPWQQPAPIQRTLDIKNAKPTKTFQDIDESTETMLRSTLKAGGKAISILRDLARDTDRDPYEFASWKAAVDYVNEKNQQEILVPSLSIAKALNTELSSIGQALIHIDNEGSLYDLLRLVESPLVIGKDSILGHLKHIQTNAIEGGYYTEIMLAVKELDKALVDKQPRKLIQFGAVPKDELLFELDRRGFVHAAQDLEEGSGAKYGYGIKIGGDITIWEMQDDTDTAEFMQIKAVTGRDTLRTNMDAASNQLAGRAAAGDKLPHEAEIMLHGDRYIGTVYITLDVMHEYNLGKEAERQFGRTDVQSMVTGKPTKEYVHKVVFAVSGFLEEHKNPNNLDQRPKTEQTDRSVDLSQLHLLQAPSMISEEKLKQAEQEMVMALKKTQAEKPKTELYEGQSKVLEASHRKKMYDKEVQGWEEFISFQKSEKLEFLLDFLSSPDDLHQFQVRILEKLQDQKQFEYEKLGPKPPSKKKNQHQQWVKQNEQVEQRVCEAMFKVFDTLITYELGDFSEVLDLVDKIVKTKLTVTYD